MHRVTLAATLLLLLLPLPGCVATRPSADTPRTVGTVDLARYVGTWYEVARFPAFFSDSATLRCEEVTATYTARPDDRIGVVNRCSNALDGDAPREARATAYVVKGSGGARLRVSFFWPFHGDYWVIGLDPDYRWAVVATPRRDYLWILSRTPAMAPADYARAVSIAREQGFDVTRLRRTRQQGA